MPTASPPQPFSPPSDWYRSDPLARELSMLSPQEYERLVSSGLVAVQPVVLPYPALVEADNGYFDWPIATEIDGTIVVLFDRRRYHWGRPFVDDPRTNAQSGIRMITCSSDGGRTWSTPIDLIASAGRWQRTPFGGWGGGLGVHEGMVYAQINEGLYRSADRGATWELACTDPSFPPGVAVVDPSRNGGENTAGAVGIAAPLWSPGMRLTVDATRGLVVWTTRGFKPTGRDGRTNSDYGRFLVALSTVDGGRTWRFDEQVLPDGIFLNEITPVSCPDGALAFFLRNGIRASCFAQAYSASGWFPFAWGVSNVGPVGTTDTPDAIYNPRTRRIEAAVSCRFDDRPLELQLWSIAPDELAAGSPVWRFDGTLVRYRGRFGRDGVDGMNPVGGIVDESAGVHRVHIWGGDGARRSGIFQYSRTLDTDALRQVLLAAER